jgi:hypothetical protein
VDYLSSLFHDGKCHFSERQLRRILRLPSEDEQIRAFEELRAAIEGTTAPTLLRDRDNGDRGQIPPGIRRCGEHRRDAGDGAGRPKRAAAG